MKQASLFNFDSEPESKQPENSPVILQEVVVPVVQNTIAEIDFVQEDIPQPVPQQKIVKGRKPHAAAGSPAPAEIPEDNILFQKKYYPIGVVAEMFKVNISLLRFWEKEFDILKPKKNGKGDRHFRPEDVKNLKLIQHLLKEKRYTIEGAKDFLKNHKKAADHFALIEELQKMKLFLCDLKMSL